MNRIHRILVVILGIMLIAVYGCVKPQQPTPTPDGVVTDYGSLVDSLRASGATVEPAGSINQPFFTVKGKVIKINGKDVQVFEYVDENKAITDADKVSPDGSFIGTTILTWVSTPHFYRASKLIILYIGQDQPLMDMLQRILGPQFAGG